MKRLLVVYHSMTGGTEQMARAVVQGSSREPDLQVRLLRANAAHPDDVLTADGYVFCTPENLASMSGIMKDFFDRCYYAALDQVNGRPYATLICAGSDGSNASRHIERIATGWRLRAIADPFIICTHAQTMTEILAPKIISPTDWARCEELGAAFASGLVQGIF